MEKLYTEISTTYQLKETITQSIKIETETINLNVLLKNIKYIFDYLKEEFRNFNDYIRHYRTFGNIPIPVISIFTKINDIPLDISLIQDSFNEIISINVTIGKYDIPLPVTIYATDMSSIENIFIKDFIDVLSERTCRFVKDNKQKLKI